MPGEVTKGEVVAEKDDDGYHLYKDNVEVGQGAAVADKETADDVSAKDDNAENVEDKDDRD